MWTVGLTVEIKLRFRDGLVWTVGLTIEIKLRFRDGLVWTVGLTVEIKLRLRDGLVWTVGLTVEIKLRFCDGLVRTAFLNSSAALCGRYLKYCNCQIKKSESKSFVYVFFASIRENKNPVLFRYSHLKQ